MLFWRLVVWVAAWASPQYSERVAQRRGVPVPKRAQRGR